MKGPDPMGVWPIYPVYYAALLLSRSNEPAEVFRNYFDQETLVRYWGPIKRRMRKNKWSQDRILFWQEIYRHLAKKIKAKGGNLRAAKISQPARGLQKEVGDTLKALRMQSGMTQQELARKAGVHQQVISKIEKGIANPSLKTIEKITKHLTGASGIQIIKAPADHLTPSYSVTSKKRWACYLFRKPCPRNQKGGPIAII